MIFTLNEQLEKDSTWICDLPLSQVRLMNNAAFPWLLLVPKQADCAEIIDLDDANQTQLFQEIIVVSKVMKKIFDPKKLNVANLGNIVSQLHVHVIARYEQEKAWPNPVWNSGVNATYQDDVKQAIIQKLKEELKA